MIPVWRQGAPAGARSSSPTESPRQTSQPLGKYSDYYVPVSQRTLRLGEIEPGCILYAPNTAIKDLPCIRDGCQNKISSYAFEHPCLVIKKHTMEGKETMCTVIMVTTQPGDGHIPILHKAAALPEETEKLFLEQSKQLKKQSYVRVGNNHIMCRNHAYLVELSLLERVPRAHTGLDYRLTKESFLRVMVKAGQDADEWKETDTINRKMEPPCVDVTVKGKISESFRDKPWRGLR